MASFGRRVSTSSWPFTNIACCYLAVTNLIQWQNVTQNFIVIRLIVPRLFWTIMFISTYLVQFFQDTEVEATHLGVMDLRNFVIIKFVVIIHVDIFSKAILSPTLFHKGNFGIVYLLLFAAPHGQLFCLNQYKTYYLRINSPEILDWQRINPSLFLILEM